MGYVELGLRANLDWERLPAGITHRDVPGVAVDSADRVHLFTRHPHQVLVFDSDGEFVKSWGDGIFINAHSIVIGPDDSVYTVDNGAHVVRKFSPDAELLLTLGTPGRRSDTGWVPGVPAEIHMVEGVKYPGPPFNGCTDLAIAANGDIYVSDGYQNCCVHRFDAKGNLLQSWGTVGSGPGEFRLPHALRLAADGRVFIADRENDRIQIFSPDGEYLDEWNDVVRPCGMAFDAAGRLYVGELWRQVGNRGFVSDTRDIDQPSRMTVFDPDGKVLARWGASADDKAAPGNFIAPHAVAIDSTGSVYVGEVTYTYGIGNKLVGDDHAGHQIQKFERAAD
jgi:sugar lactone lactonase YvrE